MSNADGWMLFAAGVFIGIIAGMGAAITIDLLSGSVGKSVAKFILKHRK